MQEGATEGSVFADHGGYAIQLGLIMMLGYLLVSIDRLLALYDPFSYLGGLPHLTMESFADRVAHRRNYNFVSADTRSGDPSAAI